MATISFNAKPAAGNILQIFAVIRSGEDRKYKSVGFTVPAVKVNNKFKFWDLGKQRVKLHEDAEAINDKLQAWEKRFADYVKECKARSYSPSITELIGLFEESKTAPVIAGTAEEKEAGAMLLLNVIEEVIKEKRTEVKKATMTGYKVMKAQLTEFEKKRKAPVYLAEVDKKFFKEYAAYLIAEENNLNSTINRKIRRLKTFMNYAFEEGYIKNLDFKKTYRLDELDANKFPLYPAEKTAFAKYVPKTKLESEVHDAFLLAMETGLRYSDCYQIGPVHLKQHEYDGTLINYLDFSAIKTTDQTDLPLSNAALAILNKYKMRKGKFFQLPTDQESNRTLKDIAKAAELTRLCEVKQVQGKKMKVDHLPLHEIISFHFARYTYITELLAKGVNPIYVQENVGHSDLKTTLKYNRTDDVSRWKATLAIQNAQAAKAS